MKLSLLTLFLWISSSAWAVSLADVEDSIAYHHQRILKVSTDAERLAACDKMREFFIASFDSPELFDYPFTKLKFCTLTSSDKHIRLLNWNMPYMDGTYTYFGFVLIRQERKKNYEWIELVDLKVEPENLQGQVLKHTKWPGALYYEIIPMEKKKCNKYTLLGWDGKDNLSTRKVVEIMTITNNGIRFGDDVFKEKEPTSRKRFIIEYSDEVSALLKYYPSSQCIVMDQLVPKNPMLEGIYSEYGPLGNYDLLRWNKGNWILEKDVDVSKFVPNEGRPYNDPSTIRPKL